MYLKSIEINGFKSFANKIVFKFDHGFTGIVGPNGSGKSNVGDAVRWVLGEQSAKQLRGAKMEDVIFSGTETRKPLGFAYVAITLDNTDHTLPVEFDEVIVARRVYRSGESEYLLNGNTCRLKDVQAMFFDTGVGKEGYSIIGQGQIDKILSGKPDERRELFDEAAGIVKYKKNKAATEKSLENERQNLSRVNDILSELTKQVGPLKQQSETAKQYLDYKEELKTLDVNVFLLENEDIRVKLEDTTKKLEIASADFKETQQAYDKVKIQYQKTEEQIEKFQKKSEAITTVISDLKLESQKNQGEINVFHEQINTAKTNDQHITNRLTQIEEQLLAKKNEKEELFSKKSVFDQQLDEIDDQQSVVEEQLEEKNETLKELQDRIHRYQSDIVEFVSETANLKAKVSRYDAMLENVQLRKVELNQRLLKYKSDESQQNSTKEDATKQLEQLNEREQAILVEQNTNQQMLQELYEEANIAKTKLSQSEQEYHRSRSKLETLKNLTERYEGYGQSIKRVMEQKDRNPGIHGVVADLIHVKKEYETAIETALGGSIQNIVTDNEQTAKTMIEFLKKGRFGRATFLPLTNMRKSDFAKKEALSEPGAIGLASQLVETDGQYNNLMDQLLGRILVVDHIDHAIAIAKKYHHSFRMVTIEGDALNPGGSMSGGAYKNSSNLLGRKRELDELEDNIKNYKILIDDARKKGIAIQEKRQHCKEESTKIQESLQAISLEKNTLQMNVSQAENRTQELARLIATLTKENQELDQQVVTINESKDKLFAGNVKHQEAKSAREEAIANLEHEIKEIQEKAALDTEQINQFTLSSSQVQQQVSFITENIKRIKGEESVFIEEKEELLSKVDFASNEIEAITQKIAALNSALEENRVKIEQNQEILNEIEQNKEAFSAEHKQFFAQREELNERLNNLDRETVRLQSMLEKYQDTLDKSTQYMWEEYELTYHHALELRNEEFDNLPQMKKDTSALKNKIKNLGAVNVNAIEDYKEVSERYEFLQTQHDDIVKAEKNLLGIIEELDVAMRQQFNEKFKEIQEMFAVVFKEMFGGGKASITLADDEDVLEAGIFINAQPPGKRLQNMMQLSGGEKALTAIALLFAIQNLKPSPFCLLDEIEAALDDANVDRFANYLHKLTNHTQFIVITHRRGTMTAADVLYGITMQEKGISTLVSVNLIEDELDQEEHKD